MFPWPFSPTWPMCHPHGFLYLRIVSPPLPKCTRYDCLYLFQVPTVLLAGYLRWFSGECSAFSAINSFSHILFPSLITNSLSGIDHPIQDICPMDFQSTCQFLLKQFQDNSSNLLKQFQLKKLQDFQSTFCTGLPKAPGHKTPKLEFKPDHFIEAEAVHIDSNRNPQLLLKTGLYLATKDHFNIYTIIIEAILFEAVHVESRQVLIITFISQLVPFHISEGWLGSNKEQIEDTFLSTQVYHFIANCRLLPPHFHFWLPITNFSDISSSETQGWHIHPWSDKSSPCAIYCDSDLPFYFSYCYPTKKNYSIPNSSKVQLFYEQMQAGGRIRPRHKRMLLVHNSDSCPLVNICVSRVYNGNIPPNTCSSCQCYLGHCEADNCPKKFRSHPIKLNNGMLVHHFKYCYHHTSIWIFRRGRMQYHSFTGCSRHLLHEQLKLAGAARGLPGDHGPSKSSFFAYQYNCPPPQLTSGHEPCRASRNRSDQNLRLEASTTRRHEKYNSQRRQHRHRRRTYRDWLSQRLRWMGPTLPIPSGSAYKVQVWCKL